VKILFDTSVLVAAMVEGHPHHAVALPWLQLVQQKLEVGLVAAHSLAELYAVLTRLPVHPRIPPPMAVHLIRTNILAACEVVALSENEYVALLDHLAEVGIAGGAVYDAIILHTAQKADADQIVTLNESDFRRVLPALAGKVVSPQVRK
jgi:predicted nucleic acid-binding protein